MASLNNIKLTPVRCGWAVKAKVNNPHCQAIFFLSSRQDAFQWMHFERNNHKDMGNTCERLLCGGSLQRDPMGVQNPPGTLLRSCCDLCKVGKKYSNWLGMFCVWNWAWVRTIFTVNANANCLPTITGGGHGRERAKGGGCPLQSSPELDICTQFCDTALTVYLQCVLRSQSQDLLRNIPTDTAGIHRCQANSTFLSNTPWLG